MPVPMVYVHDCDDPPFIAVIVATSPVEPPVTENVGVLSVVMLSEFDDPESDAARRSGAVGDDGAVVSRVIVVPGAAAPGPVTPDDAVTLPLANVGVIVPSPQLDTVTVNMEAAPVVGETAN